MLSHILCSWASKLEDFTQCQTGFVGDTGDMNCKEAMTEMGVPNEAKLYSLVLH